MRPGIVSLTFDDGWKSAIQNAYPLLHKHGAVGTFYIISKCLDDTEFPEYMNVMDVRVLHMNGHEIGSHTRSHKHLPELSEQEAYDEIVDGKKDLEKHGFWPKTFAYPYGDWNPYVVKQVREAGFLAARSIIKHYNQAQTNPYLLGCEHVNQKTTLREIKEWVDSMENAPIWLILMFHQIEPTEVLNKRKWIYGTTPRVLDQTLRYLRDANIRVMTVKDAMDQLVKNTLLHSKV